jgi:uncharacterized protein (DUF2236 family)
VGGGTTAQRPLTPPGRPLAGPAEIRARTGSLPATDDAAGLYGPGSVGWRLNREAALLLGAGPRALLLQVAHPLVAEGVHQHSGFREDPWTRLAGTLRSYLRIVYGTTAQSRDEIARLNRLHARVTGPVSDEVAGARHGSVYRALDPSLGLWVHATLVDSTLVAVDRWQEPLGHDVRARFYAETLVVGRLFGIGPDLLPRDIDAFDAYVASMLGPSGPVHPTTTARELADGILRPPLGGVVRGPVEALLGPATPAVRRALALVPQPAVDALLVPAIGLLPPTTRAEYGLPWGPRERAIDAWLTTAWRFWMPRLPTGLRWFPQARRADARVSAAPGV